jgi:small subunit ribosomal protein S8
MFSSIYSQIQNGFLSNKSKITYKYKSKFLINFLNILINNGYIYGFKIIKNKNIIVFLKYIDNQPSIKKIKIISKKKKNLYLKNKQLLNLNTSLNLYIISTCKGILSHKQALKYNLGGELLCKII